MSASAKEFLGKLESESVKFVSFCFTDTLGKWHKITYHSNLLDEELFKDGVGFDGSSISGWKDIHKSDCILKPNLDTAFADPFTSQPCYSVVCDVVDADINAAYSRDPRHIARNAGKYMVSEGFADHVCIGSEMEFFVFDDVRVKTDPQDCGFRVNSEEGPYNSGKSIHGGPNLGHRPSWKGGYFPAQPIDTLFDLRAEICSAIELVGLTPAIHHHEVAASQCEAGFKYGTSVIESADNVQKFKYAAKNVAASYGKSITFMPKPIFGDNGSGMHVHMSLWKGGKNAFYDAAGYAGLSESALYFIGGIIRHARAINAFTNSTTNSYKRLVPGYEAPVHLAYSAHNRSAAIRIPYSSGVGSKRIEVRFPDPATNPYLGFSALLMAGLDGIKRKLHPGAAIDKDLYNLVNADESTQRVCASLEEALQALDTDRQFLLEGGVFTDDFIDSYLKLKYAEVQQLAAFPHPMEFKLYYSA